MRKLTCFGALGAAWRLIWFAWRRSQPCVQVLVATIHFSPFTCSFCKFFWPSFTDFCSATTTLNSQNHSYVHYSLSEFTGEWFTKITSNHIHIFTPITRIVATKVQVLSIKLERFFRSRLSPQNYQVASNCCELCLFARGEFQCLLCVENSRTDQRVVSKLLASMRWRCECLSIGGASIRIVAVASVVFVVLLFRCLGWTWLAIKVAPRYLI